MSSVSQPERENSPFQIPQGRVEAAVATEDQNRNTIFLNALSSPIRGILQPPHMAHGGNVSDELNITKTGRGSPSHVSNAMEE
ncbi:hypothetical protein QJS10_CPA08g00138 [Acorus calamus]|uniref:Uncharacterized protein n=1 Tax=Acorus calamus TaxID=4465 RepID=A0AAV9E9D0_ACOCL|nr:hypothetical protein QJS10_CPA08g00138 [Acorus calamus]